MESPLEHMPLHAIIRAAQRSFLIAAEARGSAHHVSDTEMTTVGRWAAETALRLALKRHAPDFDSQEILSEFDIETFDRYSLLHEAIIGETILSLDGSRVIGLEPTPKQAARLSDPLAP